MESFWKWLMRANARAVLYTALVALLVVTAWWVWRNVKPLEQEPPLPPSAFNEEKIREIGLASLLEQLQVRAPSEVPENVFAAPEQRPPPSQGDGQQTRTTVSTPTPTTQPIPVQPRNTVSLVYRGVFQKPDGKIVALVEDSKSKASYFYSVSNSLFGAVITAIGPDEATLVLDNGQTTQLKRGAPIVLEGGKIAN